jgi:hypothetical protein
MFGKRTTDLGNHCRRTGRRSWWLARRPARTGAPGWKEMATLCEATPQFRGSTYSYRETACIAALTTFR